MDQLLMHVALARKYRPSLFRDVVGQDMFVRILRNALAQGRLGHGLLLTGIRGVGKTTLARLVAKALSCTQRDDQQEPCNRCPSCTALIQDNHVDIVEMDAASHTGIDDVRHILDSCAYRPLLGAYKIYIMDEIHMLSKSAFNALLKTLEEPPAHVKFIFATTDVAKVPLTIVSRCQQLHLNRVKGDVLEKYLGLIAEKEGFTVDADGLALLARCSEGGVRDALSLLERVLVLSRAEDVITLEYVLDILGLPRTEMLEKIFQGLETSDVPLILKTIETLYHQGVEPVSLLTQWMHWIHGKVVAHWHQKAQSCPISLDRYDQWWQLGQKGLAELSASPFPLLALEMLMLRMAYMRKFPTPSQILSAIEPMHRPASGLGSGDKLIGSGSSSHASSHVLKTEGASASIASEPLSSASISFASPNPASDSAPHRNRPVKTVMSLDDLLAILEYHREGLLHAHMRHNVSWVSRDNDALCLHWDGSRGPMPASFAGSLEKFVQEHLGKAMRIVWHAASQQLSPVAQEEYDREHRYAVARAHPDMQVLQEAFPDGVIEDVTPL